MNSKCKNNQVLCFGEVLWDRLPSGAKPGGAPMNAAIHLKAIGVDVSVASKVGNDKAGEDLKLFLKKSGLNTEFVQTDDKFPTSEVLVHLDKQNNATYEICEPVAWDFINPEPDLMTKAEKAGIIIYGSLASRNTKTRETLLHILEFGGLKFMDVNLRPPHDKRDVVEMLLEKTDIAKLNEEELNVIANWHHQKYQEGGNLLKWLAGYYNIQMVCVTKGKDGAIMYQDGKIYSHSGFVVRTVDTVGAGDAFLAGLVASFLKGENPKEMLAYACATGAFVASKSGATPAYNLHEINKILSQNQNFG